MFATALIVHEHDLNPQLIVMVDVAEIVEARSSNAGLPYLNDEVLAGLNPFFWNTLRTLL